MPCNELPVLVDVTDALLNRLVYVPYKTKFGIGSKFDFPTDKHFVDSLTKHYLSNFFTWYAIGAMRFFQNDENLNIPEIVKAKTQKLIDRYDELTNFLNDCFDYDGSSEFPARRFHNEYVQWFKHTYGYDQKPMSETTTLWVGTKLKDDKYNITKDKNKNGTFYIGYKLKDNVKRILE